MLRSCTALVRVVVLACLGAAVAASAAVQRQTALRATVAGAYDFQYLQYLPPGYGTGTAKWPLLIFLHGAGERGADVQRVAANGPPMLVERGRDFPCIVISPLCSESWWSPYTLRAFVADRIRELPVDPDRVYLTGLSMGGYGTWDLAELAPDLFAAIAPLCGAGDTTQAYKLRDLPVWAFHGVLDATVPVAGTQNMIQAIRQAGGSPSVTLYPDLGHDIWTITYNDEQLYTWMFAQNRASSRTMPTVVSSAAVQAAIGGSATFSVSAAARPAPAFQWQRLAAGASSWFNLTEGGAYRGVTTSALSIDAVTAGMAGDQFRVLVTNELGSVQSAAFTLMPTGTAVWRSPAGLCIDAAGSVWVADRADNVIRRISPLAVIELAAGAAGTAGEADGAATTARFRQPSAVIADASGTLYVADTGNGTIRLIRTDGTVTTLAGSPTQRGSADGAAASATFNAPAALALDAAGNLLVADAGSSVVRKISPSGAVTTLAGSADNRGDRDGTGAEARFNAPAGIAVDGNGNLAVADTGNNLIRHITPAGVVTTLAGTPGVSGRSDGAGMTALFDQPTGLAFDAGGNLFVADTGNSTIRRIGPTGIVTTVAGWPGIGGLRDGAGGEALFNQPRGVAIDAAGTVWVADTGNAAIRKISAAGGVVTPTLTERTATPSTPPTTPSTPTNPTTPPAAGSGGGGGGATSEWFLGALLLMLMARLVVGAGRGGWNRGRT